MNIKPLTTFLLAGLLISALPSESQPAGESRLTSDSQTSATYPPNVPKVYFGYSTRYQEAVDESHGSLLIKSVTPGSPADKAGLLAGDRIVAFNKSTFRFENDVQAIRSMHWIVPGEALQLTVKRGPKTLALVMHPTAADPERQQALDRHLQNLEREGGMSCPDNLPSRNEFVLSKRIRDAGGKAMLNVQRKGPELQISSNQIEIPEHFELDEDHKVMTNVLKDGESLRILVTVEGNRTSWIPEHAPGFAEL